MPAIVEMPGLACLASVAAREGSTEQAAAALSPARRRYPACLAHCLGRHRQRREEGEKIFLVVVVVMRYRDRLFCLSVCLSVCLSTLNLSR